MPETSNIRIVVADDHALFREGLDALFLSIPDTEVVGRRPQGRKRSPGPLTFSPM